MCKRLKVFGTLHNLHLLKELHIVVLKIFVEKLLELITSVNQHYK